MIDQIQLFQHKVHRAARLSQRQVFCSDLFNFTHDNISFFDLSSDLRCLALQGLQGVSNFIVIQDITGLFVEGLQQQLL